MPIVYLDLCQKLDKLSFFRFLDNSTRIYVLLDIGRSEFNIVYLDLCQSLHRFEISIVDTNTWIYVKVCIDLETFIVDIDTWIYVKIYIGLEIYIIDINTWIYVKFAQVCFLVGPL
jgi:hypothetical protein